MRIENCVPMIALCLLLCGCGKQTAEPAADLRSVYQEMSGCEMTAEVTCEQSGLEWSATLHGTYVPGGESTVEVLEPLELAGVRAVIREEGWTLEYGDLCLDAGTLTEEAVSPATAGCWNRMTKAGRESPVPGWRWTRPARRTRTS